MMKQDIEAWLQFNVRKGAAFLCFISWNTVHEHSVGRWRLLCYVLHQFSCVRRAKKDVQVRIKHNKMNGFLPLFALRFGMGQKQH